jgi:hypothetical protein
MVYDAHRGEHATLHVHHIATMSDFRGHQELTRMGGLVCWLHGGPRCNVRGKQPYTGHRVWLSPGDPMRSLLCPLHKHSVDEQPHPADTSDVHYRSREQWAGRHKEPGGGCASGPLFTGACEGPAAAAVAGAAPAVPAAGAGAGPAGVGAAQAAGAAPAVPAADAPNPLARNPHYPPFIDRAAGQRTPAVSTPCTSSGA